MPIVGAARLGDIAGRRRLLAGISLFTMASVLCGVAAGAPAADCRQMSALTGGALFPASNLSRNPGLASGTVDITTARPEAVATGMRITFAVAAILIVVALALAIGTYRGRALTSDAELQADRNRRALRTGRLTGLRRPLHPFQSCTRDAACHSERLCDTCLRATERYTVRLPHETRHSRRLLPQPRRSLLGLPPRPGRR